MDLTPPGEETPKDYATRRIDLESPESAGEIAASEAEKKSRTRKTSARLVEPPPPAAPAAEAPAPSSAVTRPLEDRPLPPPPPPPPASPHILPGPTPRNEKIWIAAIVGICLVALACICSCTIVAAAFLNNAPW
jgi:hypothetical protein